MFPSRASIPTRRACQVAPQSGLPPRASPLAVFVRQKPAQQQLRQHAMRAPSTQSRARMQSNPGRLLFTQSDVPSSPKLWQDFKSLAELGDLTAETCQNAAMRYVAVAVNDKSAWKGALQRDHNIDPYTLHYTAMPCLLAKNLSLRFLGLHMLLTASSLGYTPSTLSVMRLIAAADDEPSTPKTKRLFADTEARFKQLLQTEKNPSALTVQGLLLLKKGRYALRYFDQAIEAARDKGLIPSTKEDNSSSSSAVRQPRWVYEGSCHRERGRILLKQGRKDEAAAAFRIVAFELDLAEGYLALAKLLPLTAPERETFLLKAAQAGNLEACGLAALDAADKASEPGLSKGERQYYGGMAQEWARVAPDSEARAKLGSLVREKLEGVVDLQRDFAVSVCGDTEPGVSG